MREQISTMINWISQYYGDAVFLIMAVFSYCYLYVHNKEWRGKLLYPVALLVFCIINPVLYHFIFVNNIYWRFFWMLPNGLAIAFAVTKLLQNCQNKLEKGVVLLIFALLFAFKGTNVYQSGVFVKVQNWQKLSQETKEVCDLILEIDRNPNCIMPAALFSEVRQYSGEIKMMYGRNADGYIMQVTDAQFKIYKELEKETPDYDEVFGIAKIEGYNFVVVYKWLPVSEPILNKHEFQMVSNTDSFIIYYNAGVVDNGKTGWFLTQYNIDSAKKTSFYTLEDNNGHFIVIDGGNSTDWEKLQEVIHNHDNHITAWFVTGAYSDCVGALNATLLTRKDICVDALYTINVDRNQYINIIPDEDRDYGYVTFLEMIEDMDNIHFVQEGDTIEENGLKIHVLNAWDDSTEVSEDGTMSFLVENNDVTMLFFNGSSLNVQNRIMHNYQDNINVDYIQMSYDWQMENVVKLSREYNPKAIIFSRTQNLYQTIDDVEGKSSLNDFFDKNNIKLYDFKTAPNRVLLY